MNHLLRRTLPGMIMLLGLPLAARAQSVGIGIGTTAPNAKAALEIASSDKGLLIPRLTAMARAGIAAPVPTGLLVYQTDGVQPGLWYYEATAGWTFLNPSNDNLGNHTATQTLNLQNNALLLAAGIGNNAARPAVGTARVAGEIGAVGGTGTGSLGNDDGFLRLSAGGGTSPGTRSYIDLSGYSQVSDVNQNIVLGTGGTERVRISSGGNVGIGNADPQMRLHVAGAMMVDGGVIQRSGTPITGTTDLGLYSRNAGTWMRLVTNAAPIRFYSDDNTGSTPNLTIESSGNLGLGLGTATAANRFDVQNAARTGTHATGRAVYATGDFGAADSGVEFRHSNGTQGIGLGYNSVYAAGSNPNQDLNLMPKGSGNVGIGILGPTQKLEVAGQVFSTSGGFRFPDNSLQTTAATNQTLALSGQTLSISSGNSVTLPSSGISSVTASAPLTGNGTAGSPLGIQTASSSQAGALSASDWATFNNKYTLPGLSSGSVVFSNGSTLAQDNASLFFDDNRNTLGVGTAAPAYRLHVAHGVGTPVSGTNTNGLAISNTGNAASTVWVMYANSGDNGLAFYRNGVKEVEFTGDGALNNVSDSTKKMGIRRLETGQLRHLMRLQPKTYHYKSTPEGQLQYGFMAQELVKVYPEMVRHGRDDDGQEYWTVNYTKLIPVLVQGLQEQQATLDQQQATLQAYEQRLAALEAQVRALVERPAPPAAKK